MRTRVLIVLTIFSLVAVAGLVLPLLATTSQARTQALLLSRVATLDRLAALAREVRDAGDLATVQAEASRITEVYGEDLLLVGPSGHPLMSTGSLDLNDPGVRETLASASRNLAQTTLGLADVLLHDLGAVDVDERRLDLGGDVLQGEIKNLSGRGITKRR